MMMRIICVVMLAIVFSGCSSEDKSENVASNSKLFSEVFAAESGIDFNNLIVETPDVNYYKYVYLYNGGGVGIGDINNDDLPDIYFTSTQGNDQLFLNKGDFQFENISATSGIGQYGGQKTGVTMIDINNDGWLDIYICRAGWEADENSRRNLLFINQKNNTFKESADDFGLDDKGHSTQAAFFDYDKDGYPDMFLANHPGEFQQQLSDMLMKIDKPDQKFSDKLYRNNGNNTFTDVSLSAGINNYGYGLGLSVGDFNKDGWTDVYVANDFAPHDYYYVNNGDGTFTESLKKYFPHSSYFSMGTDMVDLNNDTYLDLFTVEMLSEDNVRQKTNMAPMDMERFSYMVDNGLHYQYMRNALQINNGNGYFSDIAYYSGVDKTDWSWGTLFGDYDNDGDDDLVVVNGFLNDTQDKDFSKKSNKLASNTSNRLTFDQVYSLLEKTAISNYAFRNEGELKFQKVSDEWGFNFKGFSNGVAYGDLDRDGDLDLIVNNINSPASLYKNNKNSGQFLSVILNGPITNKSAYQTKLTLTSEKGIQYKEYQVTRGFQSSCEPAIHFGLGKEDKILDLLVEWPDGKQQLITDIEPNAYLTLDYKNAQVAKDIINEQSDGKLFEEMQDEPPFHFEHTEIIYDDYEREVLLPHKLSQLGPALATSDVDNNGLEDFYIGGGHKQAGALWKQVNPGEFIKVSEATWTLDADFEDIDALFFDADNDGDQDLYIVSGSNEFNLESPLYQDRLYTNDGKGNFKGSTDRLLRISSSGGCVSAGDFDLDGDEDLFVGGRVVPGEYPSPAISYLLENVKGKFTDVTLEKAPQLRQAGLITSSIWTDFDKDGDQDLIAVGEWTDILFYQNEKGELTKVEKAFGLDPHIGWWNTIQAADLDGDGDDDYILGNLGLNYKYQATNDKPLEIFGSDLDGNGKRDIIIGYYSEDNLYPVRGLQCSSEQMPQLAEKFPTYKAFGEADLFEVYGKALDTSLHYKANDFSSLILWNDGLTFNVQSLPIQAQWAPIQDFIITDLNNDSQLDIIAAGNWFVAEIETPRADNGTGITLINKGDRKFQALSVVESGLFANQDVRSLGMISQGKTKPALLLVANNNNALQVFKIKKQ